MSDLIESSAPAAAPASVSVEVRPRDSRCRYWAKIIRAGAPLPAPSAVSGASDVPGPYLRQGEDELLPGDVLIEGEERHHRKARGWDYWVTWCDEHGALRRITNPGAEHKARMKAAGMAPALLIGSGEVAACIRVAHAIRLGINLVAA